MMAKDQKPLPTFDESDGFRVVVEADEKMPVLIHLTVTELATGRTDRTTVERGTIHAEVSKMKKSLANSRKAAKAERGANPTGDREESDMASKTKKTEGKKGNGAVKKRDGSCAKVHEIAEKMYKADKDVSRADIIAACVKAGVNKSTATTQYQKWKVTTLGTGYVG